MSNFISTGFITEGITDVRFLESIIKRTLDDVAFECQGQIETELTEIKITEKGLSFLNKVLLAAKRAKEDYGINLIFIHIDSDDIDDQNVFATRINPLINELDERDENVYCKIVVPIVPIQMTETWMLADKDLLKEELGTRVSNQDLGIHRNPEDIADPKDVINNAIRIVKEDETRRKRCKGLEINDLYQIIGQKLNLVELEKFNSYLKFRESIREALIKLNFMY